MKLVKAISEKHLKDFYGIARKIYKNNKCHRTTEDEITNLLIEGNSSFHKHATVIPYIILANGEVVGRFALIQDQKLMDYVQLSFFEALPNLPGLLKIIQQQAQSEFPDCRHMVYGLNGHLNYGAGLLNNKFDEPPVFGLPYNHEYYHEYFKECELKSMVSYRFPLEPFYNYYNQISKKVSFGDITVRKMNKKKLKREIEIYTYLNNTCFTNHPYWADRKDSEDYELFYPFRFFIKEENLLFAEKDGEPIGFLLWYPDFNQLVKSDTHLGLKHLIRYKLANPIDTFRFTEIAVLPEYQSSHVTLALIIHTISFLKKYDFKFGEGGFIFEENKRSIAMTKRFLTRATGNKIEPYRRYAIYESKL